MSGRERLRKLLKIALVLTRAEIGSEVHRVCCACSEERVRVRTAAEENSDGGLNATERATGCARSRGG